MFELKCRCNGRGRSHSPLLRLGRFLQHIAQLTSRLPHAASAATTSSSTCFRLGDAESTYSKQPPPSLTTCPSSTLNCSESLRARSLQLYPAISPHSTNHLHNTQFANMTEAVGDFGLIGLAVSPPQRCKAVHGEFAAHNCQPGHGPEPDP